MNQSITPRFAINQLVVVEATFIASGRFTKKVKAKIDNITFDSDTGYQYYILVLRGQESTYVRMLSPVERWVSEDELDEGG